MTEAQVLNDAKELLDDVKRLTALARAREPVNLSLIGDRVHTICEQLAIEAGPESQSHAAHISALQALVDALDTLEIVLQDAPPPGIDAAKPPGIDAAKPPGSDAKNKPRKP